MLILGEQLALLLTLLLFCQYSLDVGVHGVRLRLHRATSVAMPNHHTLVKLDEPCSQEAHVGTHNFSRDSISFVQAATVAEEAVKNGSQEAVDDPHT